MNNPVRLLLTSIFLILIQVTILNKVNLFGYLNPYIYISVLYLFPIKKNRFSILTVAFLLGLSVDIFMDSGGINTIACLVTAYLRLSIFKIIFQKSESEYDLFTFDEEHPIDVLKFVTSLTLIHHFILFTLIQFNFNNFIKNVLLNTIFTTFFTLFIYFLGKFILSKKNKNEA